MLKPDHVPKPEKEDISISGKTPDDEDENFPDDDRSNNVGEQGNFRHQAREKKKKDA